MRRSRFLLWVICGCLAVCLAGIELPELLTLTNDTSNDFTTSLTSSKTSIAVDLDVAISRQKKAGVVHHVDYREDCFLAVVDTLTHRSRDLLVLHSSWRT